MASKEQLVLLRQFIELCKHNPRILHNPDLAFYKEYLESLGAKLPPPPSEKSHEGEKKESTPGHQSTTKPPESPKEEPMPDVESDPESDLDLDNTGVVAPDNDPPLPMGDASKEVTDEMIEQSGEKRSEAMAAVSDGNLDNAVKLFTEAIELNPGSALLHAKRASALLQLNKPNAAIRDCDKAISINPDSAQGYKFRGRAHRLLGHFDLAYADFATACKLDYDDQTNAWMKEIDANAKKIQEHKRKHERKIQERELRQREQRRKQAQESYERAKKEQEEQMGMDDDDYGGMPGGMGGLPDFFNDPEIMAAFQDPEVMQAFADVSQNPLNISKYQNNPKVKKVLEKMASKMPAGAGMPGGMFGGAGGGGAGPFGGAGGPFGGGAGGASATGGGGAAPKQAKPDLDID